MEAVTALHYHYNSIEREIFCAPDAISGIGESLDKLGVKRVMVVCDPNILEKSNVVQRVQDAIGERCIGMFSKVAPHTPVEVVQEGVELAKEIQPEALVSVGGGSSHDTCKCIVMVLAEGGDIHDYEVRFEPPNKIFTPDTPHAKIPIVSVPTTMGGAELSLGGGGFTDKALGRKILISSKGTSHRVVIIDGKALATTPMPILLSTGIGQLRVAIETVYCTRHNPIGDAMCLYAIRMIFNYLPRCPELDIDVLLNMKTAAHLPMLAKHAVSGGGLNTAIGHQIGGLYGVPHGLANAIPLPHTIRFNLEASADWQVLIAQAMGIDTSGLTSEEAGLAAADGVAGLCRTLNLPATLREVGVPEDGLEKIAEAVLHDRSLATNPKPIYDAGAVMQVLRAAW